MRSPKPSPQVAFGLKIKELRGELLLTQEELAEKSGVFRTYMSRIESGRANPTLTMLYVLASALDVEVAALFSPAISAPKRVLSEKPISRGRAGR